MRGRHFGFGVLLLGLAGCNFGDIVFTGNGVRAPARAASCDFPVYTTPTEGFVEIGVVDVTIGTFAGENRFEDVTEFKEAIRTLVCEAGGDAVLGFANGHGYYIKGSVLKRQPALAPKPVSATPVPPAETGVGCHYDTQCKGDRICVQGECRSPAPATDPSVPSPPTP